MAAYLKLTDIDGNVYNFPESFWISDDSYNHSINMAKLFYAAGGRNLSDGTIDARTISLKGYIRGDTLALFETAVRALKQACLKGGYLEKSVDAESRYIFVEPASVQPGQEEGQQFQEFDINFVAKFPFWEDSTETNDSNTVTGDDTLTIDTTGTDYLIQPKIEIVADQSVDIPAVKFTNLNDGSSSLRYVDSDFLDGSTLVIDSAYGTVKLNNNDTIDKLVSGSIFIRLQPGSNTIEYEGAASTINFKYRKLYL